MSRIGKQQIEIPAGVEVQINGLDISVKGPKGELSMTVRPEMKVVMSDGILHVQVARETKATPAYWGMTRALIANMVLGVTEGFEKKLELVGVGYRAKDDPKGVSLSLGYSHPIEFVAPEGISIDVIDNQNVTIKGIDKQLVGLTAARIRKLRKPEPYKGKGIKYTDEVVRRKAGKSAKV